MLQLLELTRFVLEGFAAIVLTSVQQSVYRSGYIKTSVSLFPGHFYRGFFHCLVGTLAETFVLCLNSAFDLLLSGRSLKSPKTWNQPSIFVPPKIRPIIFVS